MRSTTNSGARRRRRRRSRTRPRERPRERIHARASWRVEQERRSSAQRGPSRAAAARRPPTHAVRWQLVGLTDVPYLPAIPTRPLNQPRGALCVSAQRCGMPGAAGGSGAKQACASRRTGTRGGAVDARDASVMQIRAVPASCAPPPPPLPRTNRTSLVPPFVLSGQVSSLPLPGSGVSAAAAAARCSIR